MELQNKARHLVLCISLAFLKSLICCKLQFDAGFFVEIKELTLPVVDVFPASTSFSR